MIPLQFALRRRMIKQKSEYKLSVAAAGTFEYNLTLTVDGVSVVYGEKFVGAKVFAITKESVITITGTAYEGYAIFVKINGEQVAGMSPGESTTFRYAFPKSMIRNDISLRMYQTTYYFRYAEFTV